MIIFNSTTTDQSKGTFLLCNRILREITEIKSNQSVIVHVFLPVQHRHWGSSGDYMLNLSTFFCSPAQSSAEPSAAADTWQRAWPFEASMLCDPSSTTQQGKGLGGRSSDIQHPWRLHNIWLGLEKYQFCREISFFRKVYKYLTKILTWGHYITKQTSFHKRVIRL